MKKSIAVLLIAAIFTAVGGLVFSAVTSPSPGVVEYAVAEKSEKSANDSSTNSAGEEKKSKKKKGKTSGNETNKAPGESKAAPASSNR